MAYSWLGKEATKVSSGDTLPSGHPLRHDGASWRWLETLQDTSGRSYHLYRACASRGLDLRLYNHHRLVGTVYACVQADGATLFVKDFGLQDVNLEPTALTLWRHLAGTDPEMTNVQGCGLGTALLEITIREAKGMGFWYLRGELHADARRNAPHLIGWLKRRGFTVVKSIIDTGEGIVTLELDL